MQSESTAEPLSVLVVDDDSALIRTLADILRLHGYEPSTAGTGREGLAIASRQAPALAVVDLRLPDMDGMELAARLHQLSELTEVVVLTGNASVESAIAALREQSVDYLVKPVNVDRLLQVASLATERWQRRHAEERLRDSDERFRRVVESDMLGIMFWEASGAIYDANDAFLRMIGYTREELDGEKLSWTAISPPEYDQGDQARVAELARAGVIPPYEKEYLRKDGTRVPILFGAATLEGRTDRGVAFVLDITDRKLAERAADARAEQQAAVAQFGQHALVAVNFATLFDHAAKLVADTLGLPLTAVLERRSDGSTLLLRAGVGWKGVEMGHTSVRCGEATQWGFTQSQKEPAIVEDSHADRRFVDVPLLSASEVVSGVTVPIPDAVQPFGVLAAHDRRPREFTLDDVHFLQAIAHVLGTAVERNRSEMAFRQAQRMEAVGRLASGISHDFNNLLAAISGFGEIVHSGLPADSPLREDVAEILKAAGSAAGLTRQLLAFSRQQVLQPREVSLNDVITQMEKMLCRLVGSDVALTLALEKDLAWVKADVSQIEQVIVNLCVNARDAMPNGGGLTIETANIELDSGQTHEHSMEAPGQYVMLSVSDTGTGMDAETRARIFEPFFTTKPADEGTGLGLATVYGVVKQSDGEIWVYSEVGQGTTFKIFLPQIELNVSEKKRTSGARAMDGGNEVILLAEDEEAIRKVAKRILEKAGYQVIVAVDGADAVRVAAEHQGRIDLLVTDLMMPHLSGTQLAEKLRANRPGIRVLYLSGFTDVTVARDGLLQEGEQFLQKPFAAGMLAKRVRETLDTRP